jgi:hypothetical protein
MRRLCPGCPRRRVEDREGRSAGREPPLDDAPRALWVAVEEADADGEDLVEAALTQVELLELRDEELGLARFDICRVPACRHFDHLRRTVDREQVAAVEALADKRRGDALPAPDLQDAVSRPDVQLLDDGAKPLADGAQPSSR